MNRPVQPRWLWYLTSLEPREILLVQITAKTNEIYTVTVLLIVWYTFRYKNIGHILRDLLW